MRNRSEATTATRAQIGRLSVRGVSRLVQPAPGPETPDARDKVGAQSGMVIMIVGGGLFWLAVFGLLVYLLS